MIPLTAFPKEYDANVVERIKDGLETATLRYPSYCNVTTDPRYVVEFSNDSGFGQASQWLDGEPLPLDTALNIGSESRTQVCYGIGFGITRNHVKYGQMRKINRWIASLGLSVAQTYNVVCATLLNNAFSDTSSHFGSKTLCSTTHTTAGASTRSNRLATDAALTPANCDALRQKGWGWINYRGLNTPLDYSKLIVPKELKRIAEKICDGDKEPSTTDNDVNTNRDLSYVMIPELTSTTAWFLQAAVHGVEIINGMLPSQIRYIDEPSQSVVHGVGFDFVTGLDSPDGTAGTSGA
ncbi:MAG: hypothetical protein GY835_24000 [bacterium]|nr:hypothetical protein [bacterium]